MSHTLQKQTVQILYQIEKDLTAELLNRDPTALNGYDIRKKKQYGNYQIYQQKRLKELIKQSRKTIKSGYTDINRLNSKANQELAVVEGGWAEDLLTANVPKNIAVQMNTVAVPNALLKELARETLIDGAKSSEWWSRQATNLSYKFTRSMRAGVYAGESLPKLLSRIKNPGSEGYIGLQTVSKANAKALVRSSVQAVTNTARESEYTANAHLIKALKWISTLDARTTPLCIERDNRLYDVETKEPIGHSYTWGGGPGRLHFSCRSTTIPVLKSAGDLNLDVTGTRHSMTGDVPSDTNYADWLTKQRIGIQEKVLGEKRAKLFREGKVKKFSTLVDQNGRYKKLTDLSAYKKNKKS